MRPTFALLLLLLSAGCASPYFGGVLDYQRIERGEVFVDTVKMPGGSYVMPGGAYMLRAVLLVDAPPSAVLSVYRDVAAYPSWQPAIVSSKVLRESGDYVEAELTYAPIYGKTFTAVPNVIRIDAAKSAVSITGFETDWLRSSQSVVTAEAHGDGSRTLVSGYLLIDSKALGTSLGIGRASDLLAQGMKNLQGVTKLSRHLAAPAGKPVERSGRRVAVPAFKAEGVQDETARTLTRVFARELMRAGRDIVVTYEEAAALLAHVQKHQLIGCDPGQPCVVELGQALSADRIVSGQVGQVGDTTVVTVSLLEFPGGKVLTRATAEEKDEAALLARMRKLAEELGAQ